MKRERGNNTGFDRRRVSIAIPCIRSIASVARYDFGYGKRWSENWL
jgi:hypothetical protein